LCFPTPLPLSRFVLQIFATKSRSRRKTEKCKSLWPQFFPRGRPQLLYSILLSWFTVHRLAKFDCTYFRPCGPIWLSSVQRAPRVSDEKRKKEERRIPVKYKSPDNCVGRPKQSRTKCCLYRQSWLSESLLKLLNSIHMLNGFVSFSRFIYLLVFDVMRWTMLATRRFWAHVNVVLIDWSIIARHM